RKDVLTTNSARRVVAIMARTIAEGLDGCKPRTSSRQSRDDQPPRTAQAPSPGRSEAYRFRGRRRAGADAAGRRDPRAHHLALARPLPARPDERREVVRSFRRA